MPCRVIRDGINTSARVNALSCGAELFYRRLLSVIDDHGRYYGHPATLRTACWPTCPDKHNDDDVEAFLAELLKGERPLLSIYESDGSHYVQVADFGQRIQSRSKFPEPPKSAPTVIHGGKPLNTVENGIPPFSTAPRARENEVGDEVGDEDGVRTREGQHTVNEPDVAEPEAPPTPPSPIPIPKRRRKPIASETSYTGAEVSPGGGVAEARVGVVRESLKQLAVMLRQPEPDDGIVRRVIDVAGNASGEDIHAVIRGLHHQERFRNMRSWGLLPVVVAPWFRSSCDKPRAEERSPDAPQDETPQPAEEKAPEDEWLANEVGPPLDGSSPDEPPPKPKFDIDEWQRRRAELQQAGDFDGVHRLDDEYLDQCSEK